MGPGHPAAQKRARQPELWPSERTPSTSARGAGSVRAGPQNGASTHHRRKRLPCCALCEGVHAVPVRPADAIGCLGGRLPEQQESSMHRLKCLCPRKLRPAPPNPPLRTPGGSMTGHASSWRRRVCPRSKSSSASATCWARRAADVPLEVCEGSGRSVEGRQSAHLRAWHSSEGQAPPPIS